MSPPLSLVEVETRGAIAVLALNRPDKLNALNAALFDALEAALDAAEGSDARAVVIAGRDGRAFSAGADFKEIGIFPPSAIEERNRRARTLFNRIAESPKVTVAAIEGIAFGGGFELALACTFRVAGREARFSFPEIGLGAMPTYGGTQRLPRLIGENRALELILKGAEVNAETALEMELLNRLARPGESAVDTACRFLEPVAATSLAAQHCARRSVTAAFQEGGVRIEAENTEAVSMLADAREGIAAFLEKRPPVFVDR